MKNNGSSFTSCFFYLLVGLILMSIVSAGQFVIPERKDIPNPDRLTGWFIVSIHQDQLDPKSIPVPEKIIWPLLHLVPPMISLLMCIIIYTIFRKTFERKMKWEDPNRILPHIQYMICHSLSFILVCLTATLFEKQISQYLSYGRIPAFYHIFLGIIMGIPICVANWLYYEKRLDQIEIYKSEILEKFRQQIESIFKLINRITLVLLVTVALGTWKILGEEFTQLSYAEKYWHTIEITFDFVICALGIIFWILRPLFDIYQKADIAYFKALKKEKPTLNPQHP